jgi:hypothetical protein
LLRRTLFLLRGRTDLGTDFFLDGIILYSEKKIEYKTDYIYIPFHSIPFHSIPFHHDYSINTTMGQYGDYLYMAIYERGDHTNRYRNLHHY